MHQGIAFRTAYLLAGDAGLAEEAAQDAFVKAYRALGRFRRGAPSGRGCLQIVANEARNRRRGGRPARGAELRARRRRALGGRGPVPRDHPRWPTSAAASSSPRSTSCGKRSGSCRVRYVLDLVRGRDRGGARRAARHREVAPVARARAPARDGGRTSERARARAARARCAGRRARRAGPRRRPCASGSCGPRAGRLLRPPRARHRVRGGRARARRGARRAAGPVGAARRPAPRRRGHQARARAAGHGAQRAPRARASPCRSPPPDAAPASRSPRPATATSASRLPSTTRFPAAA